MITFLAIIGGTTIAGLAVMAALLALEILAEVVRAYRQTCRRARVAFGHSWARKSRENWRGFLRLWRREIFASYSELEMRGIRLPHDPRKPFRRSRFWGA